MRKKLLIFIVVIFFIGVISYFITRKPPEITFLQLPLDKSLTTITKNPKNGELYFSNGRFLVAYDPAKKTSRKLSNTSSLPPVTGISFSPDNKYLAFQTLDQIDNSELTKAILAENARFNTSMISGEIEDEAGDHYKIDEATWWLINLETGSLSFIAQSTPGIEWDGSDILYANNERVLSRNALSGQIKEVYSGEYVNSFHKDGHALFISTNQGVLSYNISTGSSDVIYEQEGFIIFNRTGKCFLSASGTKDNTIAVSLHSCGGKDFQEVVDSDEEYFNFTQDGMHIAIQDKSELKILDGSLKTLSTTRLNDDGYDIETVFDAETVLAQKNGRWFISMKGNLPPLITDKEDVEKNGIRISFDAQTQSIVANRAGGFTDNEKDVTKALVAKYGYNLDLYRVYYLQTLE